MYRGLFNSLKQPLLLSHLQENELYQGKFDHKSFTLSSNLLFKIKLTPFIDLPCGLGISLELLGERIVKCSIERGFLGQNIEKNLENLSPKEALSAIAKLNFAHPYPYKLAAILAIEELYGITPKKKEQIARTVNLEIARIQHHIIALKNIFSYNQIVLLLDEKKYLENLNEHIDYMKDIRETFLSDKYLKKLLSKVAHVSQHLAASYGLTGLFLRANRVKYDQRSKNQNCLCYPKEYKIPLSEGGDLWGRTLLRIDETINSFRIIKQLQHEYETSEHFNPCLEAIPQKTWAKGLIEGPEGDLMVSLFYVNNKISWRIKTPSYFIAQALPHLLHNRYITEVSLILNNIGLIVEEIDK